MPLVKLDHVNVRTTQLDVMIDWYTTVLGMQSGKRPDFPFPGAWMYTGDTATVHLVGIEGPPAAGSELQLKLEHFAFSATDITDFESRLEALGERYQRSEVPSTNTVQLNIRDPDGNHIHVDLTD